MKPGLAFPAAMNPQLIVGTTSPEADRVVGNFG
jgi:hypothetical protein